MDGGTDAVPNLERQGCPLNERRLHERYPFRGRALLHLKVGDDILRIRYPCEIIDISEGGVRFNIRFQLAVGATFIFIQTKPDGSLSMLCGEVVWRRDFNEDMYQYGARLFDEDGSLSKELKEQIEQIKKTHAPL